MEPRVKEVRGAAVPVPGFGTWQLKGEDARRMTEEVLEMGYRHIDTAEAYGNEAEIGEGLRQSGIPRKEVFLTSKVSSGHLGSGDFRPSVDGILRRLGADYLDLLLIHWPAFRSTTLEAAVERLNAMYEQGLTRFIGVSNFTADLLEQAWSATTYPLLVNQVEYHPFLDQDVLLESVHDREMILTAYSPVAQGRAARNPVLREMGEKRGKTGAQVALRWLVQRGTVPIPRSSDPGHARENLALFDFSLSDEEMKRIHELHEPGGRIIDPQGQAPDWD